MDTVRFDTLTRLLAAGRPRRGVLRSLAGGAAGARYLVGLDPAREVAEAKKKKKKCGVCKARQGRKCKPRPDDTPCNGDGRCLEGACQQRPICERRAAFCASNDECCSANCLEEGFVHVCAASQSGQPCFDDNDCAAGECIGFVCQ